MIEVKNLIIGYGGKCIANPLDIRFLPGELTVIIGPNGSGKSTLIRTILGLQDKLGGAIIIDGENADTLKPKRRAQRMAYMAQSRSTPSITSRRMVLHGRFPYLGYPRRYRDVDHIIARRAMERTGAAELAERYLPELSGGQRQKVYLAMALAQDTQTLFMDEPTTYLDAEHQLQVMHMARLLAEEGKSVVMVLHDLCLAMRCADRILLLSDGIAADGSPDEVYSTGLIDKVFNIKLCRIMTDRGWQYYYESSGG